MDIKLIGIAGPNGAGKSAVTKLIASENQDVLRIKMDNYSNDPEGFPRLGMNSEWNIAKEINFDLLFQNLKDLKEGRATDIPSIAPVDDLFKISTKRVEPKPIVVVEGFMLFHDRRIRNLFDRKVYIDISSELIVKRRGEGIKEKEKFIQEVVIPNYAEPGEFAKSCSDIILDGALSITDLKNRIVELI